MMQVDPEILEAIYTQKDENLLELSAKAACFAYFFTSFWLYILQANDVGPF